MVVGRAKQCDTFRDSVGYNVPRLVLACAPRMVQMWREVVELLIEVNVKGRPVAGPRAHLRCARLLSLR